MHPLVVCGVWEGRCKHLADRNIRSDVTQDCNNGTEPIDTWDSSHVLAALAHHTVEEALRNSSVIETADKNKLRKGKKGRERERERKKKRKIQRMQLVMIDTKLNKLKKT